MLCVLPSVSVLWVFCGQFRAEGLQLGMMSQLYYAIYRGRTINHYQSFFVMSRLCFFSPYLLDLKLCSINPYRCIIVLLQ